MSDVLSLLPSEHTTSHVRETHYVGLETHLNPAVEFVFQKLKEGHTVEVIRQYLALEFPNVREHKYTELFNVAYNYGAAALHKDRESVFYLHAERYENVYLKSLVMDQDRQPIPLDPVKDHLKIVNKVRTAAKALRQKEELLGLHDKRLVIEITDSEVFLLDSEDESRPQHNDLTPRRVAGLELGHLPLAELADYLRLVQKSRATPLEGVQRVVVKQTKVEVTATGVLRYEDERAATATTVDATWAEDLPEPVLDEVKADQRPIGERVDLSGLGDLRSKPIPPSRTLEELQASQEKTRVRAHSRSRALDRLNSLTDKKK